jgi:hypothetical protein
MKKIIITSLAAVFLIFGSTSAKILAGDGGKNLAGINELNQRNKCINPLQKSLPQVQFDESNVVLKFAAVSDTHIQWKDAVPTKKLLSALSQLNAKANGKLDAILIAGDLTDYGLPDQVVELKRVIDSSKIDLAKTRFVFAIGNHEYYNHQLQGAPWNGGYLFRDVFGDKVYTGATKDEIKAGNYHTSVNGYDFLAVYCAQYEGGVKYAESDIKWLKDQLKQAAVKHPGKPIFVTSHPNITGTNLGSNEGGYWNGTDLYDVFKEYPQVIYLCGHLHFPENDERSIWQGDFTTIGLGSTFYCSNHPKDDETGNNFIDVNNGYETADAQQTSQGLYVEVDKNSNVKISRIDFANKEEIKKPWLIPSPKADKSHLLYYTPKQEEETFGKTAPVFNSGATVREVLKNSKVNQKYVLEFTQATDNDMIYSYQISFVDEKSGNVIKSISTLSDFYVHANIDEMDSVLTKTIYSADSILAPFSLSYKNDYYIKVIAVNCFGKKSKPIYSKIIKGSGEKVGFIDIPVHHYLLQNNNIPFNPVFNDQLPVIGNVNNIERITLLNGYLIAGNI